MKIGFIGLGAMGKPMALNLIASGYEVYVYDVAEEIIKEMEAEKGIPCSTPVELARKVDVIISSLPNAKIVESVMLGKNGVLKGCNKGVTIIDMSSVAPNTTKEISKIAQDYKLTYIDAPVSGGVTGAKNGTLTIMVGSDKETFEKVSPILNILGKNIYHVGPVGSGDAIKVVNNLLLGCNMAALAEALILGVKCGLSAETMHEIIKVSSGRSYAFEAKMDKFIMADNFSGGFAVDLQYKDLGLALEAAKDTHMPLPITSATSQIFEAARAKGLGKEDMSSIIKVWEDLTGINIH
ncbi:3-hydroxyisobutyrate dehydrogenase [Clostridium sp. DL-VIII]|uniref:NAD(P)-dependent oxidoreductase n=1 Tax=Clostridium sp. DL-VIII TaxID=641107 RepID=UPI00023AF2CF|nr:NAD(P)-dependent oxidoreductase [Clostridium sp. DL-VIII]EHI97712.1 3-hydroxyisobutyrate dehydrogenase [Clostridium sp. DL-VIII]